MDDTIAAIATSVGNSAINIIKLSGNESIDIVSKIYKGKNLKEVESNTINFGYIYNNDELIDEVLVSIFRNPKTYTGEDIVEINCHGGIAATNKILELVLSNGARLAEPGEYLKRAFLNGKVDLIKAESVQDMINANTEVARKISAKGLDGTLTKLIKDLKQDVIEIMANIEVNIDYPEYEDALIITNNLLEEKLMKIKNKLNNIIEKSKDGKLLKNGINVGILGKPNVGKSSLLNLLLDEEKAIVTNIEGTTRDIVEGSIRIKDVQFNFIDTAGIRETEDFVEQIGVKKSLEILENADILILILDGSRELSQEDKDLIEKTKDKKCIYVLNKSDLTQKLNIKDKIDNENLVEISTITKDGIEELKELLLKQFNLNNIEEKDFTYISNARQLSLIKKCLDIVNTIEEANNNLMEVDIIAIDLKELCETLGEIIGETYKEDLLNEIFGKFCLGK